MARLRPGTSYGGLLGASPAVCLSAPAMSPARICPVSARYLPGICPVSARQVRTSLQASGVAEIARSSKCSVARFERLVGLLAAAVHCCPSTPLGMTEPLGTAEPLGMGAPLGMTEPLGTAVFLAFVWSRAESKACLLHFLVALAPHRPGLFAAHAAPDCEGARTPLHSMSLHPIPPHSTAYSTAPTLLYYLLYCLLPTLYSCQPAPRVIPPKSYAPAGAVCRVG